MKMTENPVKKENVAGSRSQYLSEREIKGLEKIGDIMIPRNPPFPSFSETGCVEHVDDTVAYVAEADLKDLKMLLGICGTLPSFMVRFILWLFEKQWFTLLRFANFGVRGLIFSLYYSNKTGANYTGKKPHDVIGYKINRIPKT